MTSTVAWTPERAAAVIDAHRGAEGALLPMLHALNAAFGHVPAAAIPLVAQALNLSRAEVHGVVSFYHDFRATPPPPHVVRLCRAEACQARGGEALAAHARARLGGAEAVGLEDVYCLGLCASGPAAMIDGAPVGRLTPQRLDALVAEMAP
jgi:formate dehydrogenase subunit gamma